MKWREARRVFQLYLALVVAGLVVALASNLPSFDEPRHVYLWVMFTALLAVAEYAALSIHQQGSRYALSAAEAILLPLFVVLPLPYALLAATLANGIARPKRWRIAPIQELFNVSQYGLAAFLGAALFGAIVSQREVFTIEVAAAAVVATLVFAAMSHIFVAGAISLAGRGRFRETSLAIAPAFLLNLGGNVTLGLLLAAAAIAASWTVVLFALPLAAFYFGYRAVLSQSREKERVEHLHAASRALASSPDLRHTLVGFLHAVAEITSALEARAVVPVNGHLRWTGIRGTEVLADMRLLDDEWIGDVFDQVRQGRRPVLIGKDEAEIGVGLPVQSLLAVPLTDGSDVVGCVAVIDRVGPEGFGGSDERLMEALAAELSLSLESYRLFAEVQEERERFGRIFTGSKEGICLLDSAGVVHAWNPALERISGHSSISAMGRVWSDVVVLRDRDEHRLEGDELISAEADAELELVTKKGPSRWVSVISGAVGEDEGGGWVVLVRDVSAEHEVEAAKSDFLSTISHELRTPLTTIKGALQVMSRGRDNLPAELADKMVGVTTRGAERLERLVMNLLAVSQIESGTMPVFPDQVLLDELVKDRVASMLPDHERIVVTGVDEPLEVRADNERMGHVVEHLLDNALKFGGPQGEIRVDLVKENGYARLSVTDEGPGIPAADQERIFERFVRLGDVLTRETQGAGVGLFIAARSVEAMEGRIWVESKVGHGATIHVTIPLAHPVAVRDNASSAH